MSSVPDLPLYDLPGGGKVSTGLLLPAPGEVMVMGDYPPDNFLDKADIKKALSGQVYKDRRKRYLKWMINQSTIGKCNTSANVGGYYLTMDKHGYKHEALADNHLYWKCNGGTDSGTSLASTFNEIQARGVSRRIITVNGQQYRIPDLVYSKRQLPAGVAEAADNDARNFIAFGAYKVPKDWSGFVNTVATATARDQTIVWAWHVTNAGMRIQNGYMQCGNGPGNHANLIQSAKWVDAAKLEDCVHPDNRNSWGPSQDPLYGPVGTGWGDDGHGLVTMQDMFRCIKYHDFYVITGILSNADNSPV
jgi:hypothetical protein